MIRAHSEEDDCCGAITLCKTLEREADELREALEKIEERYTDGSDTYEDWKFMGETARTAINTEPKKS